jgi:acetyltransferase-like isoleucine patch superfamily enzyme
MTTATPPSGPWTLVIPALRRYAMMIGMTILPFSSLRVILMRCCGLRIGKGCYVGFNVAFDTNYPSLIHIGDRVTISHGVSIFTHTASPVTSRLAAVYHSTAPVTIDDGAWISANSVIVPGVRIGSDCMIGAGAVVTRNTDPESLYAGNPARLIKRIHFQDGPR